MILKEVSSFQEATARGRLIPLRGCTSSFSEQFDLAEKEVESGSEGRDNFPKGRRVTSNNSSRQDGLIRGSFRPCV